MQTRMLRWSIILCCFMGAVMATPALAQKRAEQEYNRVELQRAQMLHEQADGLWQQGKYEDAIPLAEQALKAREAVLGADHPHVARSLNLLGVLHDERGEYDMAESLYGQALAIREKALGQDHPEVASSLSNLAILHRTRGEYEQAEALYERALMIEEKTLGKDHPEVAMSLNNLAALHETRGEYETARALYGRALAIWEKSGEENRPGLALSLNNLANLHRQRGEYETAEALYVRALALWEQALGKDHPYVALCLNNLASLHGTRGQYEAAETLFGRALALWEKTLGTDHLYVAASLDNLARLHHERGQYETAERFYGRALMIEEKLLGKQHPELAMTLHNLALLHSARRDNHAALRFHEQALQVRGYQLRLQLRSGSEDQKQKRLARLFHASAPLSFHLHIAPENTRAATLAMDTILMHKGRVLDAMADTMRAARERLDEDSRDKLDRLQRLQSELAHLFHQGPGTGENALERYAQRRVRLDSEIEALDAEIARQNPAYRALARDVRVADVKAALPRDAALLELFIYRPYTFHAPGVKDADRHGEPHYAAYVVHGDGPVRGVDLGPITRIDAAARGFQESIAGHRNDFARHARALDTLIMEPIRPLLGNARKLYVAPDGQLSMVSLAALRNEQGRYLIEQYSLTYLASGRDLVQILPQAAPHDAPLIVADPRFDAAHAPMTTTASVSSSDATLRSSSRACQPISPLPGTHAEANALRAMLDDAVLWTQEKATETALATAHGPRILHIATHAFFLPDQEVSRDTEAMAGLSADSKPRITVNDGSLRSGLYLAGASQCRGSNGNSGASDDGVLTALEASSLDLRGTRLVVLSACETGLGDIKIGQGIYGLRRAFAVAGAETLVMSLWRVSDAGTAYLMRHYYDNLRRGHGRSEAMRAVQLDLIAQGGQRAHPFYWAPFIVSGNDSTLDGQPPPRLPAQPARAGCAGCASSDAGGICNNTGGWLLGLVVGLSLIAGRRPLSRPADRGRPRSYR